MCGIAGIISVDPNIVTNERLKKMTDIIAHRGPDGEGHWISKGGNVGFGHRRLSIIDLSHEAGQPMHYMNRYTIVLNGEIYNYIELKAELIKEGYQFRTQSDTEVLLALYDKKKEKCLNDLDGMFAFAIYDCEQHVVFAARDRFGEKPFFYHYEPGKEFYFGSEIKCLWEAGVSKEVNRQMLYAYVQYGALNDFNDLKRTFYTQCFKLPHSHFIKIDVSNCSIEIKKYYDIDVSQPLENVTVEKAKAAFSELFYSSVKRRLRSDVTVGSSLSGGLDSSLVVTVIDRLKQGTNQKQDTFSAIFPGFEKDEKKYIDYVINKTNVSPHFVIPDENGLLHELDKICWHQEEPFGGASIYVQYCVMQLARENNVTVLLDGQGADEILAGYHSYYLDYFKEMQKKGLSHYRKEITAYNKLHSENTINPRIGGSALSRFKMLLGNSAPLIKTAYHKIKGTPTIFTKEFVREYGENKIGQDMLPSSTLNEALYVSLFRSGLQDLLRFADRNSMAHSREVRLPFLSHELVEYILKLPADYKIRNGWTKWLMRETFTKELPPEIACRKDKIGYEPPQASWLRGHAGIREHAKNSLDYFVAQKILSRQAVETELTKDSTKSAIVWKLLMLNILK